MILGLSYKVIYGKAGLQNFLVKGIKILFLEVKYLKKTGNTALIPQAILRDMVRYIAIQIGKKENLLPLFLKRDYFSAQSWYWK